MNEAIFAQDTATIARLRDENLAQIRRIEAMRLSLLVMRNGIAREDLNGGHVSPDTLLEQIDLIRGEPA